MKTTSALLATASNRPSQPVFRADAGDAIAAGQYLRHRRVELDLATEVTKEPDQPLDQGAGTTFREMHSPTLLEGVDQRVDGRGVERVAADEQRVEAERLAQVLVLHEPRDHAVHAAIALQPDQLGRGLDHAGKVEERHAAELDVTFLEHLLRVHEEAPIAVDVSRAFGADLRRGLVRIVAVVEGVAVFPTESVERSDGDKLHIILKRATDRSARRAREDSPDP